MTASHPLPPGQRESADFPRFGLGRFARRFPTVVDGATITIGGDVNRSIAIDTTLTSLARVEQVSDFHCVTTWSRRNVRWSGFRFTEFYQRIVVPEAEPAADVRVVVLKGQDGYRSAMLLDDLLAADVLLADRVDGQSLGLEHGAPLRVVAPAHYGYKNVKHLAAIEFWRDYRQYRFPYPYPSLMDHPRARVAHEERGVGLPGWLFRYLYRPLIGSTVRNFRSALSAHRATHPPIHR